MGDNPYQVALGSPRITLTPQDQAYVNAAQGIAPGAAPVNRSPFVAPDDPNAPVTAGAYPMNMPPPATGPADAGAVSSPGAFSRPAVPGGPQGAVQFQLKRPDVARPMGGGGIDPLTGLSRDVKSTTQGYLGSMQEGRDAVDSKGIVDAEVTRQNADLETQAALEKQQMAKDAEEVEKDAQSRLTAFNEQNAKMSQEIGEQKVDPKKFFKDQGAAGQVLIGIGASLGGFLQGMRGGGPNEFMQQLNTFVDRDIAAQQGAIDNKKTALSARQNMFGQLLSQTGDRRVAAMQLRQFQLEGAKQMLTAQATRNGIPSQLAETQIKVKAIDQDIAKTKQVIAQTAYDKAKAEAAAAQGARKAEEERAWQHKMQERKMGQEDRQLDIAEGKVKGAAAGNVNEEVQKLAKDMADPELAKNRAVIDDLYSQIKQTPDGEHIPGLGLGARAVGALPLGPRLLSDQSNINRQNKAQLKLAIRNAITGSGGSKEELAGIDEAIEGAGTPAEFANVVVQAKQRLDQLEGRKMTGYSDQAKAIYEQRKNAPALPGSVKRQ